MVAAAEMLVKVMLLTFFTTWMFPTMAFIIVLSKTEFVKRLTRVLFFTAVTG